jgi:hypothetical protein
MIYFIIFINFILCLKIIKSKFLIYLYQLNQYNIKYKSIIIVNINIFILTNIFFYIISLILYEIINLI